MATDDNEPGHVCCELNKCHADKRNEDGGYCHQPAGWGTEHQGVGRCRKHGGNTPSHRTAARNEIARQAVATYGLPREVDPATALLEEVHRTAGHVAWLGAKVAELDEGDLVWGVTEEVSKTSGEFPGTDTTQAAKPNIWLELYRQERKHLVDVSAAAIRAGVDAALVRLSEEQGVMLAEVIRRTADGLLASVLGLVGDLAARDAEPQPGRFAGVVDTAMRAAWPGWLQTIVPQQIAAITQGDN